MNEVDRLLCRESAGVRALRVALRAGGMTCEQWGARSGTAVEATFAYCARGR
jgi:hypothetical protein